MSLNDLQEFFSHHCRFRFRGGKVVYGVIWESDQGLVFASKDAHEAYMAEGAVVTDAAIMPINADDVMAAELIK